jgi:hypothetical protein
MGFQGVAPQDFLTKTWQVPVYTQLFAKDYVRHHNDTSGQFDKAHFYAHSEAYVSTFAPYYRCADIMMNCIFYNKKAPRFFEVEDMLRPDFALQVIADISCDIMPGSSVPVTVQASSIKDPVFGFDPRTASVVAPFRHDAVDVMAIDNLPSELPRDASVFFGKQLIDNIVPELLQEDSSVICRACITENGQLTDQYTYLEDYAAGRE